MLTRSILRRGEGALEEPNPQVGSIIPRTPQVISHEEGQGQEFMYEDERDFRKYFFDMIEMVKVLYNEITTWLEGEIYNQPKGDGGDGSKPPPPPPLPPPPPSPPSSTPSSPPSSHRPTPPTSPRGHTKSHLLKLDVKFELPIYNGEVNVENLDN